MSSVAKQLRDMVGRIGEGDQPAETELIERYGHSVWALLLKRTGNAQLSFDLCQDTFLVALRRLRAGELRNPNCLWAFIRQIAVNLSIEHFRREKRYIHRSDRVIASFVPFRDYKARQIDRQNSRSDLDQLLDRLPIPRDREILRRFYLSDEEKEQVCRELNLTSAHFDRVLYRAKRRLRAMIVRNKGLKAELRASLYDV